MDWQNERIFCAIPKAGCSTIKYQIAKHNGHPVEPPEKIHNRFPEHVFTLSHRDEQRDLLQRFPTYAVVRDPVQRIRSCWQSKFVEHRNGNFNNIATKNGIESFDDFVQFLAGVDLDSDNPHWRRQTWFVQEDCQLVPLEKLSSFWSDCPCHNRTNGVPDITVGQMELIYHLYADDKALYEKACSTKSTV